MDWINKAGNVRMYKPGEFDAQEIREMINEVNTPADYFVSAVYAMGMHGWLNMKVAMGTASEEDKQRLKFLNQQAAEHERQKDVEFITKYGQATFDLHVWLTELYGGHYPWHERDKKKWTLKSWSDNCDQSEGFYLNFKEGEYSITFESGDGYNDDVVVKSDVSERWIYECIEQFGTKKNI